LCRALAARGHAGCVLAYEAVVARFGGTAPGFAAAGADLGACDAVLARIVPAGSLEQIIFRMDALHALEERGVLVVNSPRAIERTVDKLWTTAILERAGLAVPETVVCESPDEAVAAFRTLGDVIVKPLFGSMGLGMVRVTTEEMAFRVFRTLETIRAVYYVQRAIDHAGCDVRAFVVGGRVVGALAWVAAAAQLACLLEASAPKPGNVSPGAAFRDATYEDFLASAVAIGPALAAAGQQPLGATIRAAVEATARWAPSNTNLGLVLLLAPLARAALRPGGTEGKRGGAPLRSGLAATLAETTVADAAEAYAAIRRAAPGGLGH